MDYKALLELLRFINKSDLEEVKLEMENINLHVRRGKYPTVQVAGENLSAFPMQTAATQMATPPPAQPQQQAPPAPSEPSAAPAAPQEEASARPANHVEVKSPMVGTFYRASAPDKPPFVKVGDTVSAGQTLCIIEAMKLFNEIEAETDGRVVEILAENAQPVEFDQPLFVLEPLK